MSVGGTSHISSSDRRQTASILDVSNALRSRPIFVHPNQAHSTLLADQYENAIVEGANILIEVLVQPPNVRTSERLCAGKGRSELGKGIKAQRVVAKYASFVHFWQQEDLLNSMWSRMVMCWLLS